MITGTDSQGIQRFAVLSVVAILATLFALAMPQGAVADPDDCPTGSGWVCDYKNFNFAAGGVAQYAGNDPNYANNAFDDCGAGCALDNQTSSVWNSGNFSDTCHYKLANYAGANFHTARNTGWGNLGNINHNNTSSSHKWVPAGRPDLC